MPFNATTIRALAEGPLDLTDLRRAGGSPPPTTMRTHLRSLTEAGVIERRRKEEFAGTASYELTGAGHGLLEVASVLSAWLSRSPQRPVEFASEEAKIAIRALVEGWSTSIVRALASRPLSLTELDRVIVSISYPSLERRLSAMRLLGMVEARAGQGQGTPYTVTAWLRGAIAPLAAAARWERRHRPQEAPPITDRDVEAVFLLTLPLLRLPEDLSGSCRLAVQIGGGRDAGVVGVMVEAREGVIISTVTRLEGSPDASVLGSVAAWFAAVLEREPDGLDLSGEPHLGAMLVESMHAAYFSQQPRESLIDKSE